MQLIKCIITLVIVAMGVCAIAQTQSARRKIYIVNGFFFHRLPIEKAKVTEKIDLTASGGTKAIAVAPTEALTDLQIQSAIPPSVIPESHELLRLYNSLYPQQSDSAI
ncbi:MAG: hypothetical protein K2M19_03245 [Muribaculaceae bacterium]|nr:hypothetical protein [Muribaculaceae bacterium]